MFLEIFDVYLKIFLLFVEYNPNKQNILLMEYDVDELNEFKKKLNSKLDIK
jgi:hypothetical protein